MKGDNGVGNQLISRTIGLKPDSLMTNWRRRSREAVGIHLKGGKMTRPQVNQLEERSEKGRKRNKSQVKKTNLGQPRGAGVRRRSSSASRS